MAVRIVATLNRFPELARSLPQVRERALDAGVAQCIATAFSLARVDTGNMRSNVTTEKGAGSRTITWNAPYSAYNEFGTYKMSAQPFARPGADAALPVIAAELKGWPG